MAKEEGKEGLDCEYLYSSEQDQSRRKRLYFTYIVVMRGELKQDDEE